MLKIPSIIQGGKYIDERGELSFVNSFSFVGVKRFYIIVHSHMSTIRTWQAHGIENKWFDTISGPLKVVTNKIDDCEKPSEKLYIYMSFYLTKTIHRILSVIRMDLRLLRLILK